MNYLFLNNFYVFLCFVINCFIDMGLRTCLIPKQKGEMRGKPTKLKSPFVEYPKKRRMSARVAARNVKSRKK